MTFSYLNVNLARPIVQTLGASLIPHVMGRLGHHTIWVRSAALLGHTAALISSVAEKFLVKYHPILPYLAIPASLYAAKFVHRFSYPGVCFEQILDKKHFVIFTVVLAAIKCGVDNYGSATEAFLFGCCNTKKKQGGSLSSSSSSSSILTSGAPTN